MDLVHRQQSARLHRDIPTAAATIHENGPRRAEKCPHAVPSDEGIFTAVFGENFAGGRELHRRRGAHAKSLDESVDGYDTPADSRFGGAVLPVRAHVLTGHIVAGNFSLCV